METSEQRGLPWRNEGVVDGAAIERAVQLDGGFRTWFDERRRHNSCSVQEVPLAELSGWEFQDSTGNLRHESGRFFSVEGLRVQASTSPVPEWSQPIIHQPEIGLLGILVRRIDGVLHCLMQAKAEPGNPGGVQLSPTVQATRSNYMRVHRGGSIRYLDHFRSPGRRRVLVDVLQSEQGSWFFRKRNRNMVVEVDADVEVAADFRWVALRDLRALLDVDNMVNMDARTVLSCLPAPLTAELGSPVGNRTEFGTALARSMTSEVGAAHPGHSTVDLLSWFTEAKARQDLVADRIPLTEVPKWHVSERGLAHADGKHFRILGARVIAPNREVPAWTQPLLAPCGRGVVAFLSRRIRGTPHFLVQARVQHGHMDTVELGPTVQCIPDTYSDFPLEHRPPYLDYLLQELRPERIRYDRVQSEEGGRFFQAENRYVVAEVEDDLPIDEPGRFRWVTLPQLVALLRHSHYLNVEARSLVACLHSLW
ncbi:NDP-hexose 2,3-dehydratase family protein [Saccharopolyspora sp. HNM0986]|uniref:NDP-hexose 2,3-dehydratase family protein n=1 Tax=Saccharopolyspora galaxeae TaxID=2781241 RepID=UPI00190E2C91|nr:NDP-hexose 2,3-dehydratase family protein [Saccharopolyspora sp. HNM0986]